MEGGQNPVVYIDLPEEFFDSGMLWLYLVQGTMAFTRAEEDNM